MTAHRLTHDELMRECKRRGLRVTREPVALTPEEDRAIRMLVLAAELYQDGYYKQARSVCADAEFCAWCQYRNGRIISKWLWLFCEACLKTISAHLSSGLLV